MLAAFMAVLLKEACASELLTFYGIVRVANKLKGVICSGITFRHSTVTRVGLTSSEEMQGQGCANWLREDVMCRKISVVAQKGEAQILPWWKCTCATTIIGVVIETSR